MEFMSVGFKMLAVGKVHTSPFFRFTYQVYDNKYVYMNAFEIPAGIPNTNA